MGAARHGGYRDGQLRKLVDSDFEAVPARENGYARGDYGRFGNGGDADYGRGGGGRRAREQDHRRDRGVVRQKDVINGGYRSTSSRSDSGGSGGGGSGGGGARKNNGFPVRALDREPGELSSGSGSGSDGVADSGSRRKDGSELKKAENGENGRKDGGELKKAENGENGKRKFSPIIWDKDVDSLKSARIVKARVSGEAPTVKALPEATDSSSILPDLKLDVRVNVSPVQDDVAVISEEMVDVDMQPLQEDIAAPSPVELSPLEPVSHTVEEKAVSVNDMDADTMDVDYSSTYTMKASRWANEAESSGDEGEIYEENPRVKEKRGSESAETRQQRKSTTPELGELRRESSEENRSRHSEDRSSDTDDAGSSGSMSDYVSDEEEPAIPPPRTVNMLEACRSVEEFERLNRIDEGTYGVVFRAKDKKTREVVALKKVKMEREREGFPLTALREMNILLSFSHPSIVDVKEVVVGSSLDSIFMVMEYMEHDLKGLMESMKQPFSQSEVKCLMLQLLEGVSYLHDNWVLHRDLKTSNILLNNRGELKICDFGLARQYGYPLKPYTPLVVTLWYRAPELLLGAKEYSTAIDMWSLGCIMAELLSKQPLFNGQTEVNQLDKIFTILGAPNEKIWPGFSKLPGSKVNMVKYPYSRLHTKFPAPSYSFTGAAPVAPVITDSGFDLLSRLLTYDPAKRITAQEALDHDWFREVPLPKSKEFMPTFPAQHNQDRRTRRVMKSPDPLEEQRRKELQQGELGAGGLFG